jgi:hypothetical protein
MNRRTEMFDDRLADWLEDDPLQAPPQVLQTVLAAVPSIPQRRAGIAWRPGPFTLHLQLAAAIVLVVVASVLGLLVLRGPSVGPTSSPSSRAGLPNRVDVPLRFYSIYLPAGWLANVSTGTTGVDAFNGPEGELDVRFALIGPNTGQEAWADAYFAEQVAAHPGCSDESSVAWESARVGQQDGRLYALQCLPGWLAMTAVGDRGYGLQFTVRGGTPSATARALFARILAGMFFGQGATPPLDLSTFTSSRYGFSIDYPTGWRVTQAAHDLGPKDIPWANGDQVDLIEGLETGTAPGQPTSGTLDLGAATLDPGTTLEAFSNSAGLACGNGTGTPITIDGETGRIVEYKACYGVFHQWVTVIHAGRGYHLIWMNYPGSEDYDRVVFQQILPTFRFAGGSSSAAPSTAPTAAPEPVPDVLIGAWYHAAPGWWWFLRAGDPECVQAVRTETDCVVWQRGTTPKEIGSASIVDGNLQVSWKSGFCTRITSTYSIAAQGDALNLVDIGGGCEGGNFALTRAGTGSAPTAPPPPAP